MKKILILLAAVIFSATGAMAQTSSTRTIHGVVIDKNGNPIPGAEVMATGGAETTITDADGTFTLEIPRFLKRVTARYAGMEDKKLKPNFDKEMVFEMIPDKFGKPAWFVNATPSFGIGNTLDFNLMAGRLGKWGYFAKVGYHTAFYEDYYSDAGYSDNTIVDSGIVVTAGAIKHIYKPFNLYLGGGIATEASEKDGTIIIPAIDFGFMFRLGKHFDVTLDYRALWDWDFQVGLGVGYVF